MMSFNFISAIKRPFTDFNKLGIGIILLIIPFVNIITGFLVRGYKLEAAKSVFKKKYEMPKWADFGNLFVRGLLSWIIGIIYMLPGIIFIIASVGKIIYTLITQYKINQGLGVGNALSDQLIQSTLLEIPSRIPLFILGILFVLLAGYITPIAIMKYIEKYKFKDAFNIGLVFRKAFTGRYFIGILAILLYAIVIGLASSALNLGFAAINVQFLTVILISIINGLSGFIVMVTSYTIIAEVYEKIK